MSPKNAKIALIVLVLVLLLVLVVSLDVRQRFQGWFQASFQPWLDLHPVAAPFAYVLVYVAATVAFLPGSIITLVGGAMFGVLWGTVLVSVGSTLGATAAFLVARYLASDWAERRATGIPAGLKHGVEREGWKYVAVTRLIPLFPFNLLNYAFGLTRVRIWHYVMASWLCMLPGTVAYVYTGSVAADVAAGAARASALALRVGLALGAIVLVSFGLPAVVRRLRGRKEGLTEDQPPAEGP